MTFKMALDHESYGLCASGTNEEETSMLTHSENTPLLDPYSHCCFLRLMTLNFRNRIQTVIVFRDTDYNYIF